MFFTPALNMACSLNNIKKSLLMCHDRFSCDRWRSHYQEVISRSTQIEHRLAQIFQGNKNRYSRFGAEIAEYLH